MNLAPARVIAARQLLYMGRAYLDVAKSHRGEHYAAMRCAMLERALQKFDQAKTLLCSGIIIQPVERCRLCGRWHSKIAAKLSRALS